MVEGDWKVEQGNPVRIDESWPEITILHSFYRSENPSGENDTVRRQFQMLVDLGARVTLLSVSTDELAISSTYKIRTFAQVAFGSGVDPSDHLPIKRDSILHVHNLFPNIGTSWLRRYAGPLVCSLHNYRSVCAAATLSRRGESCELCLNRQSWNAVKHACYRNSAIASVPLAIRTFNGIRRDPLLNRANAVLVPSPLMFETMQDLGARNLRLLYQPTSVVSRAEDEISPARKGWIFVGRISDEKGITALAEAWPDEESLTIIGSGPLEAELTRKIAARRGSIEFLGRVDDQVLFELMSKSEGLVFPSIWREAAPAVYAESLAYGLPILAFKGNAVADLVERDKTGSIFERFSQDSILRSITTIRTNRKVIRDACITTHTEFYTRQKWAMNLKKIYQDAIRDQSN